MSDIEKHVFIVTTNTLRFSVTANNYQRLGKQTAEVLLLREKEENKDPEHCSPCQEQRQQFVT